MDPDVRRVSFGYCLGYLVSVVVRRPDGTVVVAGQSHDTATAYGADVLARQAAGDGDPQPLPVVPEWIDGLQRLDPARVVFAHANAVWQPR